MPSTCPATCICAWGNSTSHIEGARSPLTWTLINHLFTAALHFQGTHSTKSVPTIIVSCLSHNIDAKLQRSKQQFDVCPSNTPLLPVAVRRRLYKSGQQAKQIFALRPRQPLSQVVNVESDGGRKEGEVCDQFAIRPARKV